MCSCCHGRGFLEVFLSTEVLQRWGKAFRTNEFQIYWNLAAVGRFICQASEFSAKPHKASFVVLEPGQISHVWTRWIYMKSTWEWSEQYQNWNGSASCRLYTLIVDYVISGVTVSSLCNYVAWLYIRRLSLGRRSSLKDCSSPNVFEELHPSKPDMILCTS